MRRSSGSNNESGKTILGNLNGYLLPHMAHFMRKCGEDQFISASGKTVRIEGELMDGCFVQSPVKPFRGKVPSCLRVPLQRHQDLGQTPRKQFPVEKVVSFLKALIFCEGNDISLHNCIVPYNLHFVKFSSCPQSAWQCITCR